MSASSISPDDPVIQMLLMGRSSSGKSSSGNNVLGENKFRVQKRKKKTVAEVCEEVTQISGKQVHVIDCPDLLDPDLNKEKHEMMKELLVSRCSAGLSSVLLTIPLEESVENEEEILDYIKCLFGPEIQKYIIILFTHEDELEDLDQTIDDYLKNNDHVDLQKLVTECGGKFHCFNNKRKSDDQRQELLQKIEEMVAKNKGIFIMEQIKQRDSDENVSGEPLTDDPDETDVIPGTKELRLVLLGKTGVGKSATGNTIIGRNVFESTVRSKSLTKQCSLETSVRFGKNTTVIDTPGLYDNVLSIEEIIMKCITLSSPGPHAFIIVINLGRFTEEEKNIIKELKEMFGEQILKYTMIIFTHKDQLEKENKTFEEFLQESDPDLQTLVCSCGSRFFFLDNNSASFPQFKDLLRKIEMMVAENGEHFTFDLVEETEEPILEIQKQKLDEKDKLKQKEGKQTVYQEGNWISAVWHSCLVILRFILKPIYAIPVLKMFWDGHVQAKKPVNRVRKKLTKKKTCIIQ